MRLTVLVYPYPPSLSSSFDRKSITFPATHDSSNKPCVQQGKWFIHDHLAVRGKKSGAKQPVGRGKEQSDKKHWLGLVRANTTCLGSSRRQTGPIHQVRPLVCLMRQSPGNGAKIREVPLECQGTRGAGGGGGTHFP